MPNMSLKKLPAREQAPDVRNKNFLEVSQGYDEKMAMEEDPGNVILMHAAGANVSGQVASVIAGGMIISLVTKFL